MTIDEMIAALQAAKAASPYGGDTVAVLCVPNYDMHAVTRIELILDQAGAMVEIESDVLSVEIDDHCCGDGEAMV